MTLAAWVPAGAPTRLKKKKNLAPASSPKSAGPGLLKKKKEKRWRGVSSFQVIHEALSKLYPMIYHTDVLADLESPKPKSWRNWKYSARVRGKKLTGTIFSSSDPPKSCPRISCVRPVGLMDDRHLSCFSFAAAADDLRSVCL